MKNTLKIVKKSYNQYSILSKIKVVDLLHPYEVTASNIYQLLYTYMTHSSTALSNTTISRSLTGSLHRHNLQTITSHTNIPTASHSSLSTLIVKEQFYLSIQHSASTIYSTPTPTLN